jgi:polyketide synthase 12
VLGHADPASVRPDVSFKDLGFESLTAVELRDRLAAATGLSLPTAIVFRHPTPAGVAGYLLERLSSTDADPVASGADPILRELTRLENGLAGTVLEEDASAEVTARLESLLARWKATRRSADDRSATERLRAASADQVLDFIHNELGVS